MTDNEQHYNLAIVRELLVKAFSATELRSFCHDRSHFQALLPRFGPKYNLLDMVSEVLDYCEEHRLFLQLLAAVKEERPRQYARFEDDLRGFAQPAHILPPLLDDIPSHLGSVRDAAARVARSRSARIGQRCTDLGSTPYEQ